MKKPFKFLPVMLMCLSLCACGGSTDKTVSEKDNDNKVIAEKDNYKEDYSEETEQQETSNNTKEPEKDNPAPENKTEGGTSPHLSGTDLNSQVKVKEYSYVDSIGSTWYFMEIKNNSSATISIETNVIAKNKKGEAIGASSGSENAIEAGHTVCIEHMFYDTEPESYDYTLSVKEEDFYKPVLSDLSYETSDTGKKVIVSCTNNGTEPAEFVEGTVLFFSGKKLINHTSAYFTDDDSELKPGNTISEEFAHYGSKKYNKFKIYFTGIR